MYSGTFKENVLFGSHLEKSRYKEVVKVCALVEVQCLLSMTMLKSLYRRERKVSVNQLMSVSRSLFLVLFSSGRCQDAKW